MGTVQNMEKEKREQAVPVKGKKKLAATGGKDRGEFKKARCGKENETRSVKW